MTNFGTVATLPARNIPERRSRSPTVSGGGRLDSAHSSLDRRRRSSVARRSSQIGSAFVRPAKARDRRHAAPPTPELGRRLSYRCVDGGTRPLRENAALMSNGHGLPVLSDRERAIA